MAFHNDSGFGSNDDITPKSKRARMDNDCHINDQEIYDNDLANSQYLQNLLKSETTNDDHGDFQSEDTEPHQSDDHGDFQSEDTEPHQRSAHEGSSDDDGDFQSEDTELHQSSKRVFSVTFKDAIKHAVETGGRETIRNMLLRHVKKRLPSKSNTKNLVFKRAFDGCAINLGLPTDVLDNKVEYNCSFYNQEGTKADYANMRKYNVKNFKKSWNMGGFYIKVDKGRHTQPAIGGLKKVAEKIKIDFFPKETLYEAILRDGRLKIRSDETFVAKRWYLKINDQDIFLDNGANCYREKCFTLYQKKNPDHNLPDNVQLQLPEPECDEDVDKVPVQSSRKITPMRVSNSNKDVGHEDKESGSPKSGISPSKTIIKLCSDDDLKLYIQETYHFDIKKKETKKEEQKRVSKINKLLKTNEFALNYKSQIFAPDMKALCKMLDSVGAIVVELYGGFEEFKGSCFVIGSKYIITNKHVLDNTINTLGFKNFYVDFDHGDDGYKYRFYQEAVASSSKDGELDYAILELHDSCKEKLPPSLSQQGFVIPWNDRPLDNGMCLSLVGHPGGLKKSADIACPIKHPDNLSKSTVLSLAKKYPEDFKVLHDHRRQTYDTTSFFYGSSGSPGVLIKQRLLVVLHCRGFHLEDSDDSVIEQGIKMSAILADVNSKIESGILPGITLKDIFGFDYKSEPMEI